MPGLGRYLVRVGPLAWADQRHGTARGAASRRVLGGWRVYPPVIRTESTGERSLTWAEFVEAGLLRRPSRGLGGLPLGDLPTAPVIRKCGDTEYVELIWALFARRGKRVDRSMGASQCTGCIELGA